MGLRLGPCPGGQRKFLKQLRGGFETDLQPIERKKGWWMRYNTEIYDLYEDMTFAAFIRFRRLQRAGYIV